MQKQGQNVCMNDIMDPVYQIINESSKHRYII